jgi:hypothetical protein
VGGAERPIRCFESGTSPARLQAEDLALGHGYILVLDQECNGSVEEQVRRLRADCLARDVRLVVIAGGDGRGASVDLVVRHDAPDRAEVFRVPLRRRHGIDPDQMMGIEDVIRSMDGHTMEEVVRDAGLVKRAFDNGEPVHACLRPTVARQVKDILTQPLPGGTAAVTRSPLTELMLPLYRRSVLLSAAVFHETSLDIVVRAAGDLHAHLRGRDWSPTPAIPPFADSTKELLEWLRADLVDPPADDEPAIRAASRVIKFRTEGVPEEILELVWAEQHVAVPLILEWLHCWAVGSRNSDSEEESRNDLPKDLRLLAAMAVGRLGSLSFQQVLQRLEQWIDDHGIDGQHAAAWAVQVIVDDPRLSGEMWKKVRTWSQRDDAQQRRAAALAIYAESMEIPQINDALDLARRETLAGGTGNPLSVARLMRRAVEIGAGEAVFGLLADWLRWIEKFSEGAGDPLYRHERRRRWVIEAQGSLHRVCGLSLLLIADGDELARQQMLRAGVDDPAVQDVIDRLWRVALSWPSTAREGFAQLNRWLVAADSDSALEAECARLLPRLAASAPVARRLAFHRQLWLREWRGTHPVSARLLLDISWNREAAHEHA